MRIWLAPSAFAPHRGGVEELTLKLGQHLQVSGDEATIVTIRHPRGLAAHEVVEGITAHRLYFTAPGRRPLVLLRHASASPGIQAQLSSLGAAPDVVHVICPSVQLPPLARWARRRGIPLVITSQGETAMDAGRLYQRSAWMRRRLRRASVSAAALTACSRWTAQEAARVAPAFANASVIFNGVDLDDWLMPASPVGAPVVAAWGRHVPQKGFDLLLDAWPMVLAEIPDARLVIGGLGPETSRLHSHAGGSVEFTGGLDRTGVRRLLARSRVAVVPSRIEPFGIVAVEALAAGRGLVYSAGTGLAEAAGDCGRSADVEDPRSLSSNIIAEIRDPTTAELGRARAAALSWHQLAGEYRRLYGRVSTSR